jgi:hypothetical protein
LSTPTGYRDGGRVRTATRRELTLRTLIGRAVKGDVKAAELLLRLRAHAQRYGDVGVRRIHLKDWLPDYPGQTAEQKTREFATEGEAEHLGWWAQIDRAPDETGS